LIQALPIVIGEPLLSVIGDEIEGRTPPLIGDRCFEAAAFTLGFSPKQIGAM